MTNLAIDRIVEQGCAFNLFNPMPMGDIRLAIHALFSDLEKHRIAYTLVGEVALLSYVKGRNTQDIDLIVQPEQAVKLFGSLKKQDDFFGEVEYKGIQVDLLFATHPVFHEVHRHAWTHVWFGEQSVRCATREGLLLIKLHALPSLYRQGVLDRAALYETDILLLHQGETLDDERILAKLEPHLGPQDVQQLRQILAEQKKRTRFVEKNNLYT